MCFNYYRDLFYKNGKKEVPKNLGEILTPLGLAYWICDDGSYNKDSNRIIIATNSYELEEVDLILEVLNKNFNLICYKYKVNKGYIVVIPSRSLNQLQLLLKPIMPKMMKFKLGL